jgi:hypothetical protein
MIAREVMHDAHDWHVTPARITCVAVVLIFIALIAHGEMRL